MSMLTFWAVAPYGLVGRFRRDILSPSSALKTETVYFSETSLTPSEPQIYKKY
jgi:hypothetical protein